jgi:hypothetical protein
MGGAGLRWAARRSFSGFVRWEIGTHANRRSVHRIRSPGFSTTFYIHCCCKALPVAAPATGRCCSTPLAGTPDALTRDHGILRGEPVIPLTQWWPLLVLALGSRRWAANLWSMPCAIFDAYSMRCWAGPAVAVLVS